jgi:hypothetical protein
MVELGPYLAEISSTEQIFGSSDAVSKQVTLLRLIESLGKVSATIGTVYRQFSLFG